MQRDGREISLRQRSGEKCILTFSPRRIKIELANICICVRVGGKFPADDREFMIFPIPGNGDPLDFHNSLMD